MWEEEVYRRRGELPRRRRGEGVRTVTMRGAGVYLIPMFFRSEGVEKDREGCLDNNAYL
jgi:hypothetical protein